MLRLAADVAKACKAEGKTYRIGAVAIRNRDRVLVKAFNGMVRRPCGFAHAEARALRKAGLGATLYVSRVSWGAEKLAMARPCNKCFALLKSFQVKRCVYSIDETSYGVIEFKNSVPTERIKVLKQNE